MNLVKKIKISVFFRMSKDRIEGVQIDPVVALKISNCFNDDRAHEEERMVNL